MFRNAEFDQSSTVSLRSAWHITETHHSGLPFNFSDTAQIDANKSNDRPDTRAALLASLVPMIIQLGFSLVEYLRGGESQLTTRCNDSL